MRKTLIALAALLVLSSIVFAEDYSEVFTTGWVSGSPDYKLLMLDFTPDLDGDGLANFAILKSSDVYYNDWTTTDCEFYGANFNTPFWTLDDIGVAPYYYPSYADIDNDGIVEVVFTGRDHERDYELYEITKSLIQVYEVGGSAPEFDFESAQDVCLIGMATPWLKFDNNDVPDLMLLGDNLCSLDTYLYRGAGADTYELLWQSQGAYDDRIVELADYDFNGDYEVFISEIEDPYQTEGELKLYDYDASSDRMVRQNTWYFTQFLVQFQEVVDLDGDNVPEICVDVYDSLRSSWNYQIFSSEDENDVLFSFGQDFTDDAVALGNVFWEDGQGNHDLDHDGNPELLYFSRRYEEDTQGVNRIVEMSCYIVEYEGGAWQPRFEHEVDPNLKGVQVTDLNADGNFEVCLSYFIRGTSTYTYESHVYDPMNNYQEKFCMTLDDHQFIPYTAPFTDGGLGYDIDGDGVGEFLMLDYEWVSQTEGQYQVQIRNGNTGEIEWSKQYGRGVDISADWVEEEMTIRGIVRPSSDMNGNGKLNFGISEHQREGEDLIAARFTLFEFGKQVEPELAVWVETDSADYDAGDLLTLKIGGQNTGSMDVAVDVYLALVPGSTGQILCAPSWAPGITPWLSNFVMPANFTLPPTPFFSWMLPSGGGVDAPPIDTEGQYWFGAVLTEPGNFNNMLTEIDLTGFYYNGTPTP